MLTQPFCLLLTFFSVVQPQGISRRQVFQTIPENFPLFFRLLDKNSEEYEAQSYPRVNSEHIPVNPRVTLKSLNPDFTGVIRKSGLSQKLSQLS